MRITMKGGVWKNSEDEILKAAVMKYGLNNWSRVASLLIRKSAKQCKARWHEWLDPSVKKTEWTRAEEEKLLHLAKLFPTQWRTIAPIVGRTAHQCLEHYDRLLDQAEGKTTDPQNDPRRYRPGEIDPHPETKPSRADPVHMDEDEKEMLAEARARLANTRGKKAKRKAREKQLEQARRLASLQKRRELKAAGIQSGRRNFKRRKGDMDLTTEIPFEQQPPVGFHVVGGDENPEGNLNLANISLQQLEGKRRDAEEEALRKDDLRKLKRLKHDDFQSAQAMIDKLNDPQSVRKRTKLSLPEPQLTDAELDDIVKFSKESTKFLEIIGSNEESSTRGTAGLLPEPTAPLAAVGRYAPIRTPSMENTVMLEAENAARQRELQTPLEGGITPLLNETPSDSSTSNIKMLANSSHTRGDDGSRAKRAQHLGGETPTSLFSGRTGTFSSTAGGTPVIGSTSQSSVGATSGTAGSKAHEALLRMQIRTSLANLPQATNEIEVALPENADSVTAEDTSIIAVVPDMEDVALEKEFRRALERDEEFRKQSQVIQQNLPRPVFPTRCQFIPTFATASGTPLSRNAGDWSSEEVHAVVEMQTAENAINAEIKNIVLVEAVKKPLSKTVKLPKGIPVDSFDEFTFNEIEEAKTLIGEEFGDLKELCGVDKFDVFFNPEFHESDNWVEAIESQAYLPTTKTFHSKNMMTDTEKLKSLMCQFEYLDNQVKSSKSKTSKLENKLNVLTRGYRHKAESLTAATEACWMEWNEKHTELLCFETLEKQEDLAMTSRRDALRELVETEKQRNARSQMLYSRIKQIEAVHNASVK
eukprot:Lankesteria_metandrocarpae@DN4831_c0_g1_i1.p1